MKTVKKPPKGLKCYSDIVRRDRTRAFTIDVTIDEPTMPFAVKKTNERHMMRIVKKSNGVFSTGIEWDIFDNHDNKLYKAYYRVGYAEELPYIIVMDSTGKQVVAELEICLNIEAHFKNNVLISSYRNNESYNGKLKKKGWACTLTPGEWRAENDKVQGSTTQSGSL